MDEVRSSQILNTILARRTVRQFSPEPLGDETIAIILQMAMYAPTRLSKRPWHFVVIRDQKIRQRLRASLRVAEGHGEAPVLVAVLADTGNGFPHQWDLDAAAATQNMLLAATALGLGSSWVANPTSPAWARSSNWLCDQLGAPDDMALISLVALGHPAETPPPHTPDDVYDHKAIHHERVQILDKGERGTGDYRDGLSDAAAWDAVERTTHQK